MWLGTLDFTETRSTEELLGFLLLLGCLFIFFLAKRVGSTKKTKKFLVC